MGNYIWGESVVVPAIPTVYFEHGCDIHKNMPPCPSCDMCKIYIWYVQQRNVLKKVAIKQMKDMSDEDAALNLQRITKYLELYS